MLEIGTGSGYQAAILSRLCRQVVSIERFRTLADSARKRLERLHCDNVEVMLGDGFEIPADAGQFDRIIVTAAMEEIPDALTARLEAGGIRSRQSVRTTAYKPWSVVRTEQAGAQGAGGRALRAGAAGYRPGAVRVSLASLRACAKQTILLRLWILRCARNDGEAERPREK